MLELIDDRAARAERACRVLDAEHDAADQQRHALIELLPGDAFNLPRRGCTGIVEQAVESAETIDCSLDGRSDLRFVDDVRAPEDRVVSRF